MRCWTPGALVLAIGCVGGDFEDGQFLCDPLVNAASACPADMQCAPDGTCRRDPSQYDACVPISCESVFPRCGSVDDGCGMAILCGCDAPLECGATEPDVCGCGPSDERQPRMAANDAYGMTPWATVDSAIANDGAWATALIPAAGNTERLHLLDFGFEVPEQAVVDGIEAMMERSRSGNGTVHDLSIYLIRDRAGVPGQASNKNLGKVVGWPLRDALQTYGGPTEQWGVDSTTFAIDGAAPWSPAQINHPNFGLRIRAENDSTSSVTARVDYVRLRVHFHCP